MVEKFVERFLPNLAARASGLLSRAVDLVLPPRCFGCGVLAVRQGELCAACWSGLRFLQEPWCRSCGRPLAHSGAAQALCGACAGDMPPFDRLRAALAYDDASRGLVLAFKHRERMAGVSTFVRWMHAAARELIDDVDLIVPVPLHRWRLLRRGFNQSGLLAGGLAQLAARAWCPDLLVRTRSTASQQGLGARARLENVTRTAFALHPRRRSVEGARILLVDDVFTTGATVSACTAVLRRHGAARVDVVTLARVVRDVAAPI